jgi:hypothetical protein
MKVYEKSNHLIIAIEKKPENYLEAVDLRYCLNVKGRFVPAVTEMDKVMREWPTKEEHD